MLAYIQGNVLHKSPGYIIVATQGLGYKITLPEGIIRELAESVEFYLHEAQRDDGRELFGFTSVDQLELFWKLVSVSGVGPKSGQKIVYAEGIEQVKAKIMVGDLTFLMSVPGIGKKTAQKIILELKGALADEPDISALDLDAIEGLVGLGYSRRDAETALSGLEEEGTDDRIRAALKRLSR
ncbi:Holliday junction branch migration protein RuvA [Candidatus Uhrbacteria bacterium]|nr:Holliday junction branch migration protein RuvA [Candidatus Uhrbacteria bacterium]